MFEKGARAEGQLLTILHGVPIALLLESLSEEASLLRLHGGLHEPVELVDDSFGAMDNHGNDIGGHSGLVVDRGDVEGLQLDDALLPQGEERDAVLGVGLQRDSQGPPFLVGPVHDVDRDEAMPEPLVEAALADAAGEVGHQLVCLVLLALVVEVPDDPLGVVQHHRLDAGHLSSKETHFMEQRLDHFWLWLRLPFFIRRFLFFCCLLLHHFNLKVITGF